MRQSADEVDHVRNSKWVPARFGVVVVNPGIMFLAIQTLKVSARQFLIASLMSFGLRNWPATT